MSTIDDGGPAFPATVDNGCNTGVWGISVRDYFAAQALSGMFARTGVAAAPTVCADTAYRVADAMLANRKPVKCDGNHARSKPCADPECWQRA